LTLKHYTPSFHSSSDPLGWHEALGVKRTAIYFNPDLDIVHIIDVYYDVERINLLHRTEQETVRRIKAFVIEGSHTMEALAETMDKSNEPVEMFQPWICNNLERLEGLEELIWVVVNKATIDSVQKIIEHNLVLFVDKLREREGTQSRWRAPVVRVVDEHAFGREYGGEC
jgi:hypothetical protein